MNDRRPRSLLLVPEPVLADLVGLLEDWIAAWVVDPLMVVGLADGSVGEDAATPDVTARVIGRDGTVEVDLLDELGERPTDLLRVVAVSLDESVLGVAPAGIREEARRIQRMLRRSASTHNHVTSINLIVVETNAVGLDAERLMLPEWTVNVLASTENRTGLEAFDAFVRRSRPRDMVGFMLAHAVTLAGAWSGMGSGPYDGAQPRQGTNALDLQRVSVRGVIAQDFMVRMAQQGLELLIQEETPLNDPTIRAQLTENQEQLHPIADGRADEAVEVLTGYVLDGFPGAPLRYNLREPSPYLRSRPPPLQALRTFGAFSVDKFRMLPSWFGHRLRSGFATSTGTALHGAGGEQLIEAVVDPFGDASVFQHDIELVLEAQSRARESLDRPPAVTADGPDTHASYWSALRQGAFLLLDGGGTSMAPGLVEELAERRLSGTLPNAALICPDARDPWSPHPDVARLLEAETRDLPLTIDWLDLDGASRWADVLEALAANYDERVAAADGARRLVEDELERTGEVLVRCEAEVAAADALLVLDEYDLGPILDARVDAALAGVAAETRAMLVPEPVPEPDEVGEDAPPDDVVPAPDGDWDADADADVAADVEAGVEEREERSAPPRMAFDREAAEAWRIAVVTEQQEAVRRRDHLNVQHVQMTAAIDLLSQVHPLVTDDLLALRAWRWRLERSFAGRLVKQLDVERRRIDNDFDSVRARLDEGPADIGPQGSLYGQFVRRLTLGVTAALLFTRFLWQPMLDRIGVRYGEQSAIVAGYLGVPAYPFAILLLAVVLWTLVSYHRKWSRHSRQLARLRHELRELAGTIARIHEERLRTSELHRQAREMLRLLSEVIHRPILLDGIADALPSSRSLDPADLPKTVRFARPEVDNGWSGEIRFTQRILRSRLRRAWRTDSYAVLLKALQVRFGIVRGELDPERVDRDPAVRTAVLEHLLLDEAQRDAGMSCMRDVLGDILTWSDEANFPYPDIIVLRDDRDPVDARTDMFSPETELPEPWEKFLGADARTDERWSPMTFSTGHAQEHMARRTRLVHAPPRLHGGMDDVKVIPPRPEVRPVEMVVRVDVLPSPIAADRTAPFGAVLDPLADDDGAVDPVDTSQLAAETLNGSGVDGEMTEDVRYNF